MCENIFKHKVMYSLKEVLKVCFACVSVFLMLAIQPAAFCQSNTEFKMYGSVANYFITKKIVKLGSEEGVIQEDGSLVGWGVYFSGDIPIPEQVKDVSRFSSSIMQHVAVLKDGSVVAWDYDKVLINEEIASGVSDIIDVSHYIKGFVFQKRDSTLLGVSLNRDIYGITKVPNGLGKVKSYSVSKRHALAVDMDGKLWAWGDDVYGGHIPPVFDKKVLKVDAAEFLNAAVLEDGTVSFWGSAFAKSMPDTLSNVVDVKCYGEEALILFADSTVFMTGYRGSFRYEGNDVVEINITHNNPSFLTKEGYLGMFGHQGFGVEGIPYLPENVSDVACDIGTAAFINTEGKIRFIGEETVIQYWSGILHVNKQVKYKDFAFDCCQNYVLDTNGDVFRRSSDGLEEEYFINVDKLDVASTYFSRLTEGKKVFAWKGSLGNYVPSVNSPDNVVDFDCGTSSCIGFNEQGEVYVWGGNRYSFSEFRGENHEIAIDAVAGEGFFAVLNENGRVYFYGEVDSPVMLNIPSDLPKIIDIEAGDEHIVVQLEDSTVMAWGDNTYNQLGINEIEGKVKKIFADSYTSCALAYTQSDVVTNNPVDYIFSPDKPETKLLKSNLVHDVALLNENFTGYLMDSMGRIVMHVNQTTEINVGHLTSGRYFLKNEMGETDSFVKY